MTRKSELEKVLMRFQIHTLIPEKILDELETNFQIGESRLLIWLKSETIKTRVKYVAEINSQILDYYSLIQLEQYAKDLSKIKKQILTLND